MSTFKFTKPEKFTGLRDARAIDNWIFSVSEYLEGNVFSLINEPNTIRVAASFLDGVALAYWRQFKASNPTDPALWTFDNFSQLIRKRFYPTDYIQGIRNSLDQLNQRTTATEYNQQFEDLLYQIPNSEYTNADMKDSYIRGLKKNVRIWVLMMNVSSLEDAMTAAERCDGVLNSHLVSGNNKDDTFPMEVDAVEHKNPAGRRYQGYNRQHVSAVKCYNCNITGHLSRDCRKPKSDQTKAYEARRRNRIPINHVDSSEADKDFQLAPQ